MTIHHNTNDPDEIDLGPPTVSEQLLAYVAVGLSAAMMGCLIGYVIGRC